MSMSNDVPKAMLKPILSRIPRATRDQESDVRKTAVRWLQEKPISTGRYATIVVLLIVTAPVIAQTGPDLIKLSSAAYSALQDLNGALDATLQAQDAMIAFEQGKTPRTPSNHWSDLADRYRKAITVVRSAPLPTSFDPTPYAFTPAQLSSCVTREASLQKARRYLSALKSARGKANAEVTKMDEEIARARRANQALNYLIDKHVQLAALPTFGSIFALDFLTLETEVRPALSDLDTTLKEHRKKTGQREPETVGCYEQPAVQLKPAGKAKLHDSRRAMGWHASTNAHLQWKRDLRNGRDNSCRFDSDIYRS